MLTIFPQGRKQIGQNMFSSKEVRFAPLYSNCPRLLGHFPGRHALGLMRMFETLGSVGSI